MNRIKNKAGLGLILIAGLVLGTTACSSSSAIVNDLGQAVKIIEGATAIAEASGLVPLPVQAALTIALPVLSSVVGSIATDVQSGKSTPAEVSALVGQLNDVIQKLPPTTGLSAADAGKINAIAQIAQLLITDLTPQAQASAPTLTARLGSAKASLTPADIVRLEAIKKKADTLTTNLKAHNFKKPGLL